MDSIPWIYHGSMHVLSQCIVCMYNVVHIRQLDLFILITTDGKSVVAMCLLYYLLPDTRARPDHRRVLTLIQVCVDSLYTYVICILHKAVDKWGLDTSKYFASVNSSTILEVKE